MSQITIHVCDPAPHSSFEEQWGAQLGAREELLAEQDAQDDFNELARLAFTDQLDDPDFEPDFEHETDFERYTEVAEPEGFDEGYT